MAFMRSRILAITTDDGLFRINRPFPPTKNADGSVQEEKLKAIHIEQTESCDDEGNVYGFYTIYGEPEDPELVNNGVMIRCKISYSEVKRVIESVPAEDVKTRYEAYAKTLGPDFAELSTDLPREQLLVQQARIEKALEALDAQDDEGGAGDEKEPTEPDKQGTPDVKPQAQAVTDQ
jgi:hypothetical protein